MIETMDSRVSYELSKLDPSVPFRCSVSHVHHTWAKTFYSRPELYIQPQSVSELQKAVTLARRCRRRLVTVGSGHSPSDLTCTSSWMINLDGLSRILSVDPETRLVTVEAGIRLHDLGVELEKQGLALPNLGSIDAQSIAGVFATATHGSSLRYGLLSETVRGLSITLANGQTVRCSATSNVTLFRAALVSLGALGVITEVTFRAIPAFNIAWEQTLKPISEILDTWESTLWTSAEFIRVWWMPYGNTAVVWKAEKTSEPLRPPPKLFYGGRLGFHIYHNLLYLSQYFPRMLPWVEWFIFGMQYGFQPGGTTTTAVEPGRTGLLMDCLYSQYVNEWALPLERGPEAISRLDKWLKGDHEAAKIPFPSNDLYVHSPVEVRVTDTSRTTGNQDSPRPYLDPTMPNSATLYLNATLYRPYNYDPPCRDRYYEAFEWLMRELGGRPHWAKNFTSDTSVEQISGMYGKDIQEWAKVRNEVDPNGMFVGEWHRRNLPLGRPGDAERWPMEESEKGRKRTGDGDAMEWMGKVAPMDEKKVVEKDGSGDETPSPPMTATSEESFDYLAKGEASVHMSKHEEDDE